MPTKKCPDCGDVHECRAPFRNTVGRPPKANIFHIKPPKHYLGDQTNAHMLNVLKSVGVRKQKEYQQDNRTIEMSDMSVFKQDIVPQFPPEPLPIHAPEIIQKVEPLSNVRVLAPEPEQQEVIDDSQYDIIAPDKLDAELSKSFVREASPTYVQNTQEEVEEPTPKVEKPIKKKKKWTDYSKERPWEKTAFDDEQPG